MQRHWTRRHVLQSALSLGAAATVAAPHVLRAAERPRRTIIVMCDGFGLDYFEQSPMPTLKAWAAGGVFARAKGMMPSVTNCNNASICCGAWPSAHGVIGNSYLDPATGTEAYMEDASLVLAPTIFERAGKSGVRSALLSSKKKTVELLHRGTEIALTAEVPDGDWERRLGKAPPIYSREINYWLFAAALDVLRNRPEIGLLYIHPTDYPMHMWPPQAPESQEHLARLDALARRDGGGGARCGDPAHRRSRDEFQIAQLGSGEGAGRTRRAGAHRHLGRARQICPPPSRHGRHRVDPSQRTPG